MNISNVEVMKDDVLSDKAKNEIVTELTRKNKPNFGPREILRTSCLGAVGEKLTRFYLKELGFEIEESLDPMDKEKDFSFKTKDGQWHAAEVKTQLPYFNNHCFTFRDTQLKKIKNASFTFFLSSPVPKNVAIDQLTWPDYLSRVRRGQNLASEYESHIFMYRPVVDHMYETVYNSKESDRDKRVMYGIKFSKMTKLYTITNVKHLKLLDHYGSHKLGLI